MRATFALAALLLALTGCGGGGSDEPTAEATTEAPPRVYTLEELTAALPTVEQVPGGRGVDFRCPENEDLCQNDEDYQGASVYFDLDGGTEAATELSERNGLESAGITVVLEPDESAAEQRVADQRDDVSKYDGEYDIPREELENGFIPGEVGAGEITDYTNGAFTGYQLVRETDSDAQGEYDGAALGVRSGPVVVTVSASLTRDGRQPGAALALAEQVLTEYLERLG